MNATATAANAKARVRADAARAKRLDSGNRPCTSDMYSHLARCAARATKERPAHSETNRNKPKQPGMTTRMAGPGPTDAAPSRDHALTTPGDRSINRTRRGG